MVVRQITVPHSILFVAYVIEAGRGSEEGRRRHSPASNSSCCNSGGGQQADWWLGMDDPATCCIRPWIPSVVLAVTRDETFIRALSSALSSSVQAVLKEVAAEHCRSPMDRLNLFHVTLRCQIERGRRVIACMREACGLLNTQSALRSPPSLPSSPVFCTRGLRWMGAAMRPVDPAGGNIAFHASNNVCAAARRRRQG